METSDRERREPRATLEPEGPRIRPICRPATIRQERSIKHTEEQVGYQAWRGNREDGNSFPGREFRQGGWSGGRAAATDMGIPCLDQRQSWDRTRPTVGSGTQMRSTLSRVMALSSGSGSWADHGTRRYRRRPGERGVRTPFQMRRLLTGQPGAWPSPGAPIQANIKAFDYQPGQTHHGQGGPGVCRLRRASVSFRLLFSDEPTVSRAAEDSGDRDCWSLWIVPLPDSRGIIGLRQSERCPGPASHGKQERESPPGTRRRPEWRRGRGFFNFSCPVRDLPRS